MLWRRWTGILACVLLIFSCFLNWAWYPDIEEYFSGFYSKNNYYGRPGMLLSFFAVCGIVFYSLKKEWSNRLNLIFSAIAAAYAITSFLRFTSGYDGFVPETQPGLYLMLIAATIHLIMAVMVGSMVKTQVPVKDQKQVPETGEGGAGVTDR